MTIAITAPQKFAFQDLVCIEIMLRFCAYADATLFVEPDDGEDAELTVTMDGRRVRYEIQVKGAEGRVTLADVVSCLAHTPPRRADSTFLERLISDADRVAMLVMSGRADDSSSIYLGIRNQLGERHPAAGISVKDAKAVIDAFAAADISGSDKSKLKVKRQTHNAAFAASANVADVCKALGRVVVFDQIDDAGLKAQCAERLRRDHGVPSDRTDTVLLELRAAIATAKTDKLDAFPLFRDILARASPAPIRPVDYIERGDETALIDELSRDNVLLLSGTPRVGKTYTARWIGAEFIPLGYQVQEFADVDSAERFLLDPGTAPRLALLNDPLGSSQISADATRSLSRLANMIGRIRPQRKLLVAQGQEPLLATARTLSLDRTVTGHRRWHDVSNPEPAFLVSLWRSLASSFAVETELSMLVDEALATGVLILEPGCLEHLAANAYRLHMTPSINDVVRLAHEDAAQFGRALAAEGMEDLAVCLSVTTAPQEPIGLTSLAYVRGSGGSGFPGKRTERFMMVTIGDSPTPPSIPPTYDESPKLAASDRENVDRLERQRLITIDEKAQVGFAHPFYRAAAETLLHVPTYQTAQSLGHVFERGLFCLSPQTSRATARNLDWVCENLETRPTDRAMLITHAISGLSSFFPATRDLCFRFLLRQFPSLPVEQQNKLPQWIGSVTSVRLEDLEWSDGEAHLPYGAILEGDDYFDRFFETVNREDVATELAILDAPEGSVTPEKAAVTLRFLASSPSVMTPTAIGRLLSYDEAALRAAAIRLWLSHPREDDDDVLERIFADDHPSCAQAALKGVIESWDASNLDRRERQLDGLAALAENVAAAAAMLDYLVLFDRVEHTGERPPWPIFERLMPVVMASLPHNAVFIDARLFSVARSALGTLSPQPLIALCDGWISWLERNERAGQLPSESSLGVSEILLRATAAEPMLRETRVARMLAFTGTGAKIRFIADFVDYWELLRVDERTAVFGCLMSGNSDGYWLQAVALTRSEIPDEIVGRLFPKGFDLSQSPEQLVNIWPPMLIEAALHVYTGQPQPLWWLGTHHSGRDIWEPVVEIIARRPDHPLFELAWDHITSSGEGRRVAHVIADLGAENADNLLGILLRIKVRWNGNFMPEAWATLLRLARNPKEYNRWLDQMAEASIAILDDISDLRLWLTEESDLHGMLNRLKCDCYLLELLEHAKPAFDPPHGVDPSAFQELQDQMVKMFELLIRKTPPLLFGTCDRLIERFKGASVDTTTIITVLNERRAAIFAEREIIKTAMERPDAPLVGWIDP